jgi:hypothetical protein
MTTVLHKIAENPVLINEFFTRLFPNKSTLVSEPPKPIFDLPITRDFKGKTFMHLILKKKDFSTINNMVYFLSGFDFDHHSKQISDIVGKLIKRQMPNLNMYLDSRLIETIQTKKINEGDLLSYGSNTFCQTYTIDQYEAEKELFGNFLERLFGIN